MGSTSVSSNTPPQFNENDDYECWSRQIHMWSKVTSLAKNKQAFAVVLSLKGPMQTKAMQLTNEELDTDDGLVNLMTKLDSHFKKDTIDHSYEVLSSFRRFTRTLHQENVCLISYQDLTILLTTWKRKR